MPHTPQTLSQFLKTLSPAELVRIATPLMQGRPVPQEQAAERLFHELVSFPAIEQRLGFIPVREAAETIRHTLLHGGYLPWSSVNGSLAAKPEAIVDLLHRYFLGTVGTPDLRSFGLPSSGRCLIAFPEITISYLRNHHPVLPHLFALQDFSEAFMDAMDEACARIKSEISHSTLDQRKGEFLQEIRRLVSGRKLLGNVDACARQIFTVLSGEWLMERSARVERRSFKPWENLSDRERCSRLLVLMLTAPGEDAHDAVRERHGQRLLQVARTLEADRWYSPDTLVHLTLLEELCEELEGAEAIEEPVSLPGRPGTGFEAFASDLHAAFFPMLAHAGVLEIAVSAGQRVAERLTREGMAALSQRMDWQHWRRLRGKLEEKPATAHAAVAIGAEEIAPESGPYLKLAPGQTWENRFSLFPEDLRRFLLLMLRHPLAPTRRGRPTRFQLRQLRSTLGWSEEYADFMFDFSVQSGLTQLDASSNRYVHSPSLSAFFDADPTSLPRAIATYFWQESFAEGPISEDHRELKHVFVLGFLASAGQDGFARLDSFWRWLEQTPSQKRIAGRWRRYVDDDDEVLSSVTIAMARTMTWLGLAETCPDASQPELVRLSPAGSAWLVNHSFEETFQPAVAEENGLAAEDGGGICAPLSLPFEVLADLARLTEIISLGSPLKFHFDEAILREAARRGENPGRATELLKRFARPAPKASFLEPILRVQRELERVQLHPASGYLRLTTNALAEEVAALPKIAPLIEAKAGRYLILKPGVHPREIVEILEQSGYLVQNRASEDDSGVGESKRPG